MRRRAVRVRNTMTRLRLIVVVALCLAGFRLKALMAIAAGKEITMSYGDDACDCDRDAPRMERS